MNVVGVVPCRSGGQRVRDKNTRMVFGMPLWEWTYGAAKKSRLCETWIATDVPEEYPLWTKRIRRAFDAEPHEIMRMALDSSPEADAVLLLNPTSPLRGHGRIDEAIEAFRFHESIVSVVANGSSQFRWRDHLPGYDLAAPRIRTQDAGWLEENGAIYGATREALARDNRLVCASPALLIMDEWESIDVDTEHDLEVAEWMLGRECFRRKPRVG